MDSFQKEEGQLNPLITLNLPCYQDAPPRTFPVLNQAFRQDQILAESWGEKTH